MKNEFVPYEIALAMKELGFDEVCLGFYDDISKQFFTVRTDGWSKKVNENASRAPLYQQAFRWFRDELKDSALEPYDMVKHYSHNMKVSWEEAQDACLRKLIEIVNQNKDE